MAVDASPATLAFLVLSLWSLSVPCRSLAVTVPIAVAPKTPVLPPATAPKPPVLPPALALKPPVLPPALAPKPPVLPPGTATKPPVVPPALAPKPPVLTPGMASKPPVLPPAMALKPPVLPPAMPPKPPLLPPAMVPNPGVLGPAMAPVPWEQPGYDAKPVPEPVKRACVRTPFPDLCARALSFSVDPQRAADMRRLMEASTRVAIEAGTALAAFGYVHAAGAKNGTRLRMCVRDCTVRVDAAVKSLNASAAALRRGARAEAGQLLGEAAKGCGACWGSCARFTGEAMHVMQKRARQFEKLVMIASAILLILL